MVKKLIFNWWYKRFPPPMVHYWMYKESARAKVTKSPKGHLEMHMEGEKYPLAGFPRGFLLYSSLSKLKHNIKNKIFNDSWALLEEGKGYKQVVEHVKSSFTQIIEIYDGMRADILPPDQLVPSVKEIWRAWTVIEDDVPLHRREMVKDIKEILCFILQEDDGYRFRVQWLAKYFPKRRMVLSFTSALRLMEHAEIVGDMKERIRLLTRILASLLKDENVRKLFEKLCKEIDWKKVKLTKADKYYFRGKWFKVDYDKFDY